MTEAKTQYSNIINIITLSYGASVKINYNEWNEQYIMSLIFTNKFNIDDKIAKYFLAKDYTTHISPENIKYYNINMKSILVNNNNKTNKNIVDIDISLLNNQNIIKYYFLLDFLTEFYGFLVTKPKINIITIKSRYIIEDNKWVIYKKGDYFTFDIIYTYDEKQIPNYRLQNSLVNLNIINEMLNVFKEDILRHLTYIQKKDIQQSLESNDQQYLYNIKVFYKFCRLKLIFYTFQCILYENKIRFIEEFIDSQLAFYFLNLKNLISIKNVDQKNILITNTLLLTKSKLQKLNDSALKKRDKLIKFSRNNKNLNLNYMKNILYVSIVITILVLSIMIYIYNKSFNVYTIRLFFYTIFAFVIVTWFIIRYTIHTQNIEKYENSALDVILRFPRQPAEQYTNTYIFSMDNIIFRIIASVNPIGKESVRLFDYKIDTYWETGEDYPNGIAKNNYTGTLNYNGEYAMIYLGENIILKNYIIKLQNYDNAPVSFRIYAYKYPPSMDQSIPLTPLFTNWDLLQEIINVKYDNKTNQKKFELRQNNIQYFPAVISAGSNHSIVIAYHTSASGSDTYLTAYTTGWNKFGQLGNSDDDPIKEATKIKKQFEFKPMLFNFSTSPGREFRPLKNIIQVSAGDLHTLLLNDEYKAYGCGNNEFGQLGLPTNQYYYSLQQLNINDNTKRIIQVCAGHVHSLFLLETKKAYACGKNENGQLGIDMTTNNVFIPSVVKFKQDNIIAELTNIIQVATGLQSYNSFFLKSNGKVYCSGRYFIQTIKQDTDYIQANIINIRKNIIKISAAGDYCLFLTQDNNVLAVGENTSGRLGIGAQPYLLDEDQSTIFVKNAENIIDISAGVLHSLYIDKDKNVWATGNNNYYQTGATRLDTRFDFIEKTNLTNIVQVSAGYRHSLFLDNNGNIWTAGFLGEGALGRNDFSINLAEGKYINGINNNNNPLIDIDVALTTTISVSPIDLCAACNEMTDTYKDVFRKQPFKITYINYEIFNGPFTLINGYKNKTTNVALNTYNAYAIIVNRIASSTRKKLQIKELELYGVYEDQSKYLEDTYNNLLNTRINIINTQISGIDDQIKTISTNLVTAIETENRILEEIRGYETSIRTSIADLVRVSKTPDANLENVFAELQGIQDQISNKSQGIMYIEALYAASNTESNILVGRKFVLDRQIIEKQGDLADVQQKISDYAIIKGQVDDLLIKTDKLKTDFRDTSNVLALEYLKAFAIKQSCNQQYIDLSLDIGIQDLLIGEQETIVTQYGTQIAGIRADVIAVNTRIANDISLRDDLISAYNSIDQKAGELLTQEQRRDTAESDRNTQIGLTSQAHLEKDAQVKYANGVTDLVVRLQDEFDSKVQINEGIKITIENLKSEIASIQENIYIIERDTTTYLDILAKNQAIFQKQKEREKLQLQLLLNQLALDLDSKTKETSAYLQEYQRQITEYEGNNIILNTKIQEFADKILSTRIQLQRAKYIPYAIDIKSAIIDIQTKITYNINNVATVISNSIIITGMQDEYDELYDQKDSITNIEYTAKNNLEVLKRDKKIVTETIVFILNILLLSVISFIIYSYYPHLSVLILLFLLYVLFVTIYIYNITQIVRTQATNNYWPKPERQISKLI
jgi:alpha-tubulin suppressor-like RCC1 family protein